MLIFYFLKKQFISLYFKVILQSAFRLQWNTNKATNKFLSAHEDYLQKIIYYFEPKIYF